MLTINLYPDMEIDKNMEPEGIIFPGFPQDKTVHLIKVIGVGGAGSNAVRSMYKIGVKNVGFAICNTDSQALVNSNVPIKIQLGAEGLGVGGDPLKGRSSAEESINDVSRLFDDDTRMVFIAAGMGGGTGTGAGPVIARAARERGLLTIGVVTLPFLFERGRMDKALKGVMEMKDSVDSLLVINNERLLQLHKDDDMTLVQAFDQSNDVLATTTKTIAEIITQEGIVNRDFNDVSTVMKNGGGALVSVGYASGENRILRAMSMALESPLLNLMDIQKAQRLLYIIYTSESKPVTMSETADINNFMDGLSDKIEVLWGLYPDNSIGDQVKVAVVATGFDQDAEPMPEDDEETRRKVQELRQFYYPTDKKSVAEAMQEDKEAEESAVEVEPTEEGAETAADCTLTTDHTTSPDEEEDEEETGLQTHIDKAKTWFHVFWEKAQELMKEEED